MSFHRLCFLFIALSLWGPGLSVDLKGEVGSGPDYPRVYRTFMPDSGPSAFAVEFSGQVALCYDPSRGGINYIWGGGLDLSPTLQAKINAPAKPLKPFFYTESISQPLRLKDVNRSEVWRFKGYRYEKDAVVFEFSWGGHRMVESLRLSEDGRGIIREIILPQGCGEAFLHLESQEKSVVKLEGGKEVSTGCWGFAEGSRIVIHITPK